MKQPTQVRSLTTVLKHLPPQEIPHLYPAMLTLIGLAVAEAYGLIPLGGVKQIASPSVPILPLIAKEGLALNHRYGTVLPEPWLDQIAHGRPQDSSSIEPSIQAIALLLSDHIEAQTLDATYLGKAHELLLGNSLPAVPPHQDRPTLGAFPSRGRKCQGAYYTPPAVVDYIVNQTIQPLLKQASGFPHVLDPACGGGVFLSAAYRYLLRAHIGRVGRSPTIDERIDILQHSIFGVDLDPQAVTVTRLALHLDWLRCDGSVLTLPCPTGIAKNQAIENQAIADILTRNIQHGNALIAEGEDGLLWDSAFPDVMATGGFDVVLGNPPYLDSERMTVWMPHWRRYCTDHYVSAQGNWDLFCVFIEKALTLCKPGGYHSFIVPNKLAAAPYAAAVRSLLTTQAVLQSIRDYSNTAVFSAAVYPLVYVVQRRSPSTADAQTLCNAAPLVRYECMGRSLDQVHHTSWLSSNQFTTPNTGWLLSSKADQATIVLKLSQHFPRLETLAHVQGAATVSEAYELQPLIYEQDQGQENKLNQAMVQAIDGNGERSLQHAILSNPQAPVIPHAPVIPQAQIIRDVQVNTCRHPSTHASTSEPRYPLREHGNATTPSIDSPPTSFQIINSGTIDRYHSLWAIKPLRYLGNRYVYPVIAHHDLATQFPRRYQQAAAAKIIVAGMTKRLECVADEYGCILAGKSTSIIRPH
ncbi:MAG: N-6 DNA methylase, partial [Cyanobacteria bacterium P01_A01_bin.37]